MSSFGFKLRFLVGLPRAGKDTYAERWVERSNRVIVSGDSFRQATYGRNFYPGGEALAAATMDTAIKALLLTKHEVLVNDTNTRPESWLRYLRIDINAEPILIDTPVEECIRRAHASGKSYLEGPIRRMAAQLEVLKSDWEGTLERLREYLRGRQAQDVTV